jgi:membrane fusion protein, multidrug efflux system
MKNIILLALVATVLFSCSSDKKAKLEKLRKEYDAIGLEIKKLEKEIGSSRVVKTTVVKIAELRPTEFNHYVEIQGKLDGDEFVAIQPRNQGGIVTKVYVKEGDNVRKGQVLAQLDDMVLQKNLRSLKTNYELAKTMFEKQKALWDQQIGSEVQYLQAKAAKEGLENQVTGLEEQIEMSKLQSPIDGTVAEVNARAGQIASPSLPLPAFRVVNFRTLKAVAEVAEAYSSKVKEGDEISLYFPDIKHDMKAKVNFTSKYINPTNRTFTINAEFAQDQNIYRANMVTVVKINDYKAKDALIVPINVIQSEKDKNYIYVAGENGAKKIAVKKYITTGLSFGGMVEITEGLAVGDKIITAGYQNLENNAEITF